MDSICIVLDAAKKVVATHPPIGTTVGSTVFGGLVSPPGKQLSMVEMPAADAGRRGGEDLAAYHARLEGIVQGWPDLKMEAVRPMPRPVRRP